MHCVDNFVLEFPSINSPILTLSTCRLLENSGTKLPAQCMPGRRGHVLMKCSFHWHIRRILCIIFTYATKFRHSKLIFTNYLQIIPQKYRIILIQKWIEIELSAIYSLCPWNGLYLFLIFCAMHAGQERWVWRGRGLAASAAPVITTKGERKQRH